MTLIKLWVMVRLQGQARYLLFSSKELLGIEGHADCFGQRGSQTGRRGSSLHHFQCNSDGLEKRQVQNGEDTLVLPGPGGSRHFFIPK